MSVKCIVCGSAEHEARVVAWAESAFEPSINPVTGTTYCCMCCAAFSTVRRTERNACPHVDGVDSSFCDAHAPALGTVPEPPELPQ